MTSWTYTAVNDKEARSFFNYHDKLNKKSLILNSFIRIIMTFILDIKKLINPIFIKKTQYKENFNSKEIYMIKLPVVVFL